MIFFNVEPVRDYLIEHGKVYTLRKKRFRIGNDVAIYGTPFKQNRIGKVYIQPIEKITHFEQLIPYVAESGLLKPRVNTGLWNPKSRDEMIARLKSRGWLELAKKLSGDELYLYKVSLREKCS